MGGGGGGVCVWGGGRVGGLVWDSDESAGGKADVHGERPVEARMRGPGEVTEMFGAKWTSNGHVTSAGESAAALQDLASVLTNSIENTFQFAFLIFFQSVFANRFSLQSLNRNPRRRNAESGLNRATVLTLL